MVLSETLNVEIDEKYTPRLSQRFRMAYQDAKRGIWEDIILYSFGLFYSVFADYCYNFLYLMKLSKFSHPIEFGVSQIVGAVVFTMLLARKISQVKYYQ